jgi:RNA polymerase sigma-70 factor, ECF subfamily
MVGVRRDPDKADDLTIALEGARTGDEQAFRVVYQLVHPALLRYGRLLVGEDAEDVVSETWLQIVRDLPRFSGDGAAFRGWASIIARHRALDRLRHRRRRPTTATPLEEMPEYAAEKDTADLAMDEMSTHQAVALIASLPLDQAEAVMLRVVLGLDPQAAAKVLGKRPGAVRMASHRGLRRLAEVVQRLQRSEVGDHGE